MDVVAGSYEEIVFGYKIVDLESEPRFESAFSDHSHGGCVRAVAVNQRGILATGGTDEIINLFNLKRNVELGNLMHHKGAITCLEFYKKSYMFSGSEDGTIGVWHMGKWECLRTLKGHKGSVTSLSVHPSGKLALSVSRDKTMRTWNLITGKSAYIVNIKQVAYSVMWSPSGESYLVLFDRMADIYSVQTGAVCCTLKPGFRVNAVRFIKGDVVALAGEDGKVALHSMNTAAPLHMFNTYTVRVKGLSCCPQQQGDGVWLVTASSDGKLQLWKLSLEKDGWRHQLACEMDTKFRLTCLTLYTPSLSKDNTSQDFVEVTEEFKVKSVPEEVKSEPEEVKSDYAKPPVKKSNRKRKMNARKGRLHQDAASPEKRKIKIKKGKNGTQMFQ